VNRYCVFGLLALSIPMASGLHTAYAGDSISKDRADFIARHLDMLSFPSSLWPRRRPGANTLMDYGFTHFKSIPNGVDATEDDADWHFVIELVSAQGDASELRVVDRALNGGTYRACSLIKVKMGADGLFHAIGKPVGEDFC